MEIVFLFPVSLPYLFNFDFESANFGFKIVKLVFVVAISGFGALKLSPCAVIFLTNNIRFRLFSLFFGGVNSFLLRWPRYHGFLYENTSLVYILRRLRNRHTTTRIHRV